MGLLSDIVNRKLVFLINEELKGKSVTLCTGNLMTQACEKQWSGLAWAIG